MKQVYYGSEAAADAGTPDGARPAVLPIPERWPVLAGLKAVRVDRRTGKLASRWCAEEDQYVEYFLPGTEPTEFCDQSGGRRFRIPREP